MDWLTDYKIPLGSWIKSLVDLLNAHAAGFFDFISWALGGLIDGMTAALIAVPPLLLLALLALLAWLLHRSWQLVALVVVSLLLIINLGYWQETLETLALVVSATAMCMLIGVPLGILAAHRPRFYTLLRPVLDLMQTIPTFVYLIPTLILFGLGVVPGLISTVIFALPAPIRLTYLGVEPRAAAADRGRPELRRQPVAAPVEGRAALRHADHHGRPHPVHHALALDGRDRGPGRRRRPGQARGAGAQHGQRRARLRGRARHRAPGHHARPPLPAPRRQWGGLSPCPPSPSRPSTSSSATSPRSRCR